MQFKVPQNISMEDRIAGPLTMMQFIILVVGGGFAWIEYNLLTIFSPINTIIAILIATLATFLSVGQFNGQPMYRFFRYILMFAFTPHTRIWHKGAAPVQLVRPTPKIEKTEVKKVHRQVSKADIAHLAAVLDSRGSVGLPPQQPK
jgi:hypothetical protein